MTKNSVIALVLIGFGVLMLLNRMGIHTGSIMGWIIPISMVGLGWLGLKNGRNAVGWILLICGGLILMSKMSGLIMIGIAIALIVYGVSLLRKKSAYE